MNAPFFSRHCAVILRRRNIKPEGVTWAETAWVIDRKNVKVN